MVYGFHRSHAGSAGVTEIFQSHHQRSLDRRAHPPQPILGGERRHPASLFYAALFHDDWLGTIEYRFRTEQAQVLLDRLHE